MKQSSDLLVSTHRQMAVPRQEARMLTTTESKQTRFAFGGVLVLFALYITIFAAVLGPFVGGTVFILIVLAFPSGFLGFHMMSSLFVKEESGTR
jgi:ABC-type multidrug transport system permease subunit